MSNPSPQTLRMLDLMNQARSQYSEEGRRIHGEILRQLGAADSPQVAQALAWDQEAAEVASDYARRCARWGQISHRDLEDGSTPQGRLLRKITDLHASGENLGQGTAGWFDVEICHEGFMDEPQGVVDNHRGNILNPLFTHAGVGLANGQGQLFVVVNFTARDGAVASPAAASPPVVRTPAQEPGLTRPLKVRVYPDWIPFQCWTFELDRNGGSLRDQLQRQLSLSSGAVLKSRTRYGAENLLDHDAADEQTVPDGLQLAISLSAERTGLERSVFAMPVASSAEPTASTAVASPEPQRTRPPMTLDEAKLLDRLARVGAGAGPKEAFQHLLGLFPERLPGSPRERALMSATVSLTDATQGEVEELLAVALQNVAPLSELEFTPGNDYSVLQELNVAWDTLDDSAGSVAQKILPSLASQLRAHRLHSLGGRFPFVFLQPFAGDAGWHGIVGQAARRAYWFRSPVASQRLLEATHASRGRAGSMFVSRESDSPRDLPVFSLSSSVAVLVGNDLEREEIFWLGLDRIARAAFSDLGISAALLKAEALQILGRLGLAPATEIETSVFRPEEHLQQQIQGVLLSVVRRSIVRSLNGRLDSLDAARRRDEPRILEQAERMAGVPEELGRKIPGIDSVLREIWWMVLSRLRSEMERSFERHAKGRDNRSLVSFEVLCGILAEHLERRDVARPKYLEPADQTPSKYLAEREADFRRRLQQGFRPLMSRFRLSWRKRLARLLFPWTRSALPNALDETIRERVHDLAGVLATTHLQRALGEGSGAVAQVAEKRVGDACRQIVAILEKLEQARVVHQDLLWSEPTIVASDATSGVADSRRRAKNQAERYWIEREASGDVRWTEMGEAVLSGDLGSSIASAFGVRVGSAVKRLLELVGNKIVATSSSDRVDAHELAQRIKEALQPPVNEHRLRILSAGQEQGPQDLRDRTFFLVLVGRPLQSAAPEYYRELQRLLESEVSSGHLVWLEIAGLPGLIVFQECHGIPISCVTPLMG